MKIRLQTKPKLDQDRLQRHIEQWKGCTKCPLGAVANKHVLYDILGPTDVENIDLAVVGESPGQSENMVGRPFVGRSGKLLRNLLDKYRLPSQTVLICNPLACRPVGFDGVLNREVNRKPEPSELAVCAPRLVDLLDIFNPQKILAAGRVAGEWCDAHVRDLPVIKSYHPSYVIRQGKKGDRGYDHALSQLEGCVRRALER